MTRMMRCSSAADQAAIRAGTLVRLGTIERTVDANGFAIFRFVEATGNLQDGTGVDASDATFAADPLSQVNLRSDIVFADPDNDGAMITVTQAAAEAALQNLVPGSILLLDVAHARALMNGETPPAGSTLFRVFEDEAALQADTSFYATTDYDDQTGTDFVFFATLNSGGDDFSARGDEFDETRSVVDLETVEGADFTFVTVQATQTPSVSAMPPTASP